MTNCALFIHFPFAKNLTNHKIGTCVCNIISLLDEKKIMPLEFWHKVKSFAF